MPMMMYLPQSPSMGPYMMQDQCSPYGSPTMMHTDPQSPHGASTSKDDETPKNKSMDGQGSPMGQQSPFQLADQGAGYPGGMGMPFGGLFTMPVDKMSDGMTQPGAMVMVPMGPMFMDQTQGFGSFGEPGFKTDKSFGRNSNVDTQAATNSGGSGSDSLDGSDADSTSEKQPFQSQYLWTETAEQSPPLSQPVA